LQVEHFDLSGRAEYAGLLAQMQKDADAELACVVAVVVG
jgi:hypothetical protein